MNKEMMRADVSILEFVDDALAYNGEPFTGISIEKYHSGNIKQEHSYIDGFPNGLCRDWYESGELKSEWIALRGEAPREVKVWFDNGQIKSKKISEHGVELRYEEWDSSGNLICNRELTPDSPMATFLERMRSLKSK